MLATLLPGKTVIKKRDKKDVHTLIQESFLVLVVGHSSEISSATETASDAPIIEQNWQNNKYSRNVSCSPSQVYIRFHQVRNNLPCHVILGYSQCLLATLGTDCVNNALLLVMCEENHFL